MASLSDKAYELRKKYKKIHGNAPRGWYHGEETMQEYEEYLKKILNEKSKK